MSSRPSTQNTAKISKPDRTATDSWVIGFETSDDGKSTLGGVVRYWPPPENDTDEPPEEESAHCRVPPDQSRPYFAPHVPESVKYLATALGSHTTITLAPRPSPTEDHTEGVSRGAQDLISTMGLGLTVDVIEQQLLGHDPEGQEGYYMVVSETGTH